HHDRPGRVLLRRLWHAARGDRPRRRVRGGRAGRYRGRDRPMGARPRTLRDHTGSPLNTPMERKGTMTNSVLLCDDALFTRTMLKAIVEKAGFDVVGEADNGRKAVEQYAALRPRLVLMDIVMPDMSGIEAV